MTSESPALQIQFEHLESPQNAIEAFIVSPREPETKQEPCPIRPITRGDQNPEEAPETAIAIATATATITATGPVMAARGGALSPGDAALAVPDHARDQNVFL
jgi:hypothetical protein